MAKSEEINKDKRLILREKELINKSDCKLDYTLGNFISKRDSKLDYELDYTLGIFVKKKERKKNFYLN